MENMHSVFISYKRDGGSSWAEVVRMGLLLYGGDANGGFSEDDIKMDVHSNSQDWHEEIVMHIKNCVNVIVIIHKGFEKSLHKENEIDIWLEEIELAYRYKRAIIPFFVDGLVVDEKLDEVFNEDKRLDLLKQICHKHQQLCYTPGKCEGSIIALRKALKNEKYVSRMIKFQSIQKCNLVTPDEIKTIEKEDYIYSMKYSQDTPITIKAEHEQSKKTLTYHLCFEDFADEYFKSCAQSTRLSQTDVYIMIKDKTPFDENEIQRTIFIDWQAFSTTVNGSPINPTSTAISLFSSYSSSN